MHYCYGHHKTHLCECRICILLLLVLHKAQHGFSFPRTISLLFVIIAWHPVHRTQGRNYSWSEMVALTSLKNKSTKYVIQPNVIKGYHVVAIFHCCTGIYTVTKWLDFDQWYTSISELYITTSGKKVSSFWTLRLVWIICIILRHL